MNESNSSDPAAPAVAGSENNPWGGSTRVISDDEFARSQRVMQRTDLRIEAELPDAAVAWWRFRSKMLGGQATLSGSRPAFLQPAPSGHDQWDCAYNAARTAIERRLERDTGVIVALIGSHGSGKTVLATGLLLLVTWYLRSARYTTLFDLALKLEAALSSHGERTREEVIREYRQPRLLVIDECSASAATESESRCLRGILDHRYYKKRDTILIANATAEGFTDFLGEAIASRSRQGGGFFECNWGSFRK